MVTVAGAVVVAAASALAATKKKVDELVYVVDMLTREMPWQASKKQKLSIRLSYI